MKYLLFAGDNYYPEGGAMDFINSFSTLQEGLNLFEKNKNSDWVHVLCVEDLKNYHINDKYDIERLAYD